MSKKCFASMLRCASITFVIVGLLGCCNVNGLIHSQIDRIFIIYISYFLILITFRYHQPLVCFPDCYFTMIPTYWRTRAGHFHTCRWVLQHTLLDLKSVNAYIIVKVYLFLSHFLSMPMEEFQLKSQIYWLEFLY